MQHPIGRLASVRRLVWAALAAPAILSLAIACNDSPLDPSAPSAIDATPSASLTGALTGATVSLSPQLISSKCMAVNTNPFKAGAAIVLRTCASTATQQFVWTTDGHLKVGGLCVVDGTGRGRDLDPAVLWTCSNEAYQKWQPTSSGEIKGINGKCLDVTGSRTADGTPLILYACHGGSNQIWNTRSAGTTTSTSSTTPPPSTTTPPPTTTAPSSGSTGPSSSLNPTSGVVILPGQSIQAAVNAHPEGTTFWLKAGTWHQQNIAPKNGQSFIGEVGAILDGDNVTGQAFFSRASNVTIRNLIVQHYAPPVQDGAIRGDWNSSSHWTVDHNEVRSNSGGAGIYVVDSSTYTANYVHDNGQFGLMGRGSGSVVSNNEIAHNNTGGNDPNWAAGGVKFFYTIGMRFTGNYVHDNIGPGIWFDTNNLNNLIDGNRVVNNVYAGIFYEVSYGAIIRNNTVTGNGGTGSIARSGILISASPNVEVYGNTLSGNSNGIVGLQADRSSVPASYGAHLVQNLSVHDNNITASRGVTGLVDQVGDGGIFNRNNKYDRDTYYQSTLTRPFYARGGSLTTSQWRAAGFDLNGIFH